MGVLESNGGRRPLCHVINVQIRPERKHIQTPMIIRIHLTYFLKVMVNEHLMSTNIINRTRKTSFYLWKAKNDGSAK